MNNDQGRPAYTDDQYRIWLEEMRPFLERGKSLYKSMELSALLNHQTTLYEKYRLKDWFSQKVDAYQKALGEKVHDIYVTLIENINAKVKRGESLTDTESKQLAFYAEKSRATQSFFVNRFETAQGKPVEEILESLDGETVDDVAQNIQGQLQETPPNPAIAAGAVPQDAVQSLEGVTLTPDATT